MILTFVINLILIIILHELSHFLVAKAIKCKVLTVSLGFGKPIFKKKIGDTVYQITYFLFGGFCKLKGELKPTRAKGAFINLPYTKKFLIAVAGISMNLITGIIALITGYNWNNYYLIYFGLLSLNLGIVNILPIAPCLDGGYIFYFPLFIKLFGKKRGIEIFAKSVDISFKIITILNIISIPVLIFLIMIGKIIF